MKLNEAQYKELARDIAGTIHLTLDVGRVMAHLRGRLGWRSRLAWLLIRLAGRVLRCKAVLISRD